jgi:formylglycine-generating enzyme required for sulfatase activity
MRVPIRNIIANGAALIGLATTSYAATPTITGVTAQQRYPWNGKVDISYTVTDDIAEAAKQQAVLTSLKVTATDRDANKTYTATQLSGNTALTAGAHSIVWDMDAEGLTFKSTNVVFKVSCETTPATYCVIDLSAGSSASSYPVTYLASPPSGGFNVNAYKTTKLVLKRIEAGTFIMGDNQTDESHRVTLTKPFFCGLFEVTQKQYTLVTGTNPSNFSGDTLPVEQVSYDAIRGASEGSKWPSSSAVDSSSFMGKLRSRTNLDFDLPTEAQWEYACRAGTTTTFSYGNSVNNNYMWYWDNSSSTTHTVGSKRANPWGLYDMHGNVREWCLDCYGSSLAYGTDPKGSSSGSSRVHRGGDWLEIAGYATSYHRSYDGRSIENNYVGFRIARTLSN